jgi:hypothetical protein
MSNDGMAGNAGPGNAGPDSHGHFSDEELLLFAEGEVGRQRAEQMQGHLDSCLRCHSRELEIRNGLAEVVHLHRRQFDAAIPSGVGPRALLKARLDAAARAEARPWWRRFELGVLSRRFAYGCVVLGLVALCLPAMYRQSEPPPSQTAAARPMPNSSLTPGATRPVALADICSRRESDLDPEVSPSMKKVVFQEYGIADAPGKSYQVDYLINPQLGGTDDIHNLWPQPYGATVWNARAKDALEDRLYHMVCEKQLDLASAQRDIATDWISAYKKYFHTAWPV